MKAIALFVIAGAVTFCLALRFIDDMRSALWAIP